MAGDRYYWTDLALVHHLGFGFHADACAPGILAMLEPVRALGGVVVELGCGSGLLTRHLLDAGNDVIATDASPAILDLARQTAPDARSVSQVVFPDDPIPDADAIIGVGHALNYLPDEASLHRALVAIARALRPGTRHWGALVVFLGNYVSLHRPPLGGDTGNLTVFDADEPARIGGRPYSGSPWSSEPPTSWWLTRRFLANRA